MNEELLNKLHKYCRNNIELIEKSKKCYCFYCKSIVDAKEVLDATTPFTRRIQTAFCPRCDIDSLIPDAIDEKITKEIIDDMHEYWFERVDEK